MFLAYVDDSGTQNKHQKFQVACGVLIPDSAFKDAETHLTFSLELYLPGDKIESFSGRFTEFKGSELFGGYGAFEEIPETNRFEIITFLLKLVRSIGFR